MKAIKLFGWTRCEDPMVEWEFMRDSEGRTAGIVSHRGAWGGPTWFACAMQCPSQGGQAPTVEDARKAAKAALKKMGYVF